MIATVGVCKNEADIIELWVRHHLAEGVDRIYVSDGRSTDGTREILDGLAEETGQVTVLTDTSDVLLQARWTNLLAHQAGAEGADWILPTDIDEFVYACDGSTLADALANCPHDKLYSWVFQHMDWDTRHIAPKRMPKVGYRYNVTANVVMGNHEVSVPGGEHGIIDIRELQFRSFAHYQRKVALNLATLDPAERARGNGAHYIRLEGKSEQEMWDEWQQMCAIPSVEDPIPTHLANPRDYWQP